MRGKLCRVSRPAIAGFNEARALCAGNCGGKPHEHWIQMDRFNEARALCAGNSERPARPPRHTPPASMRPALYARETRVLRDDYLPDIVTASMRPALYARETCHGTLINRANSIWASMRPALYARETEMRPGCFKACTPSLQ